MIRIWEEEVHFHKGYAFACTENTVATPYRLIFKKTKTSEYLRRLKYSDDFSVIVPIVSEIAANNEAREFLEGGILIAVPPAKKRNIQPVEQLAQALSVKLSLNYIADAIPCEIVDTTNPIPETQRAKNRDYVHYYIPDTEKLRDVRRDAKIILFDDYYDTGSTMRCAAGALEDIGFTNVNVFTVGYTKAAKKRFMQNHRNTRKKN